MIIKIQIKNLTDKCLKSKKKLQQKQIKFTKLIFKYYAIHIK